MKSRFARLKELRRYPSLAFGLAVLAIFLALSVYVVIALPYGQASGRWNNPRAWDDYPRNAEPVWFDLFTKGKSSRSIVVPSEKQGVVEIEPLGDDSQLIRVVLPFTYDYDGFPQDIKIYSSGRFGATRVPVTTVWHTPDGRAILLQENRPTSAEDDIYYVSQDRQLSVRLEAMLGPEGRRPHIGLFANPSDMRAPVKGDYRLVITAELPKDGELRARLVMPGEVYGWGGTDHNRRDLMIALLWGAPIGLAFGLLAAVGAQLSTFVLAGISTWLGGRTEKIMQWLTQVNVILPMLPVLIMVGYLYTRSIWVMLGLVIALNVFSASMFTYRAMFLQAKEAPYIEAAQAYGVGNARMIFQYLLPRISPTLLPQFVLVVPQFIFLEATLSVLGLGDPRVPTWGKIINDAYANGALHHGLYYWIAEPAFLLMLLGIGFALVGYSLDRIFNPRLRTL